MNLRKLLLSVFVVLFVGFGTTFAQEEGPIDTKDINNPGIEFNEAQKSFGIMNFLTSSVEGPSSFSGDVNNVAIIEQVGSNNTAYLDQNGSNIYGAIILNGLGNTADLLQKGSDLQSVINMQGNYNLLKFDQIANNRNAYFKLEGNSLKFNARQTNSGFTLSPQQSSMPFIDISTTRQTLPIIISNN